MIDLLDVIVPTCKTKSELLPGLAIEIMATAGMPVRVIETCQQASAAHNRNYGLDRAKSPLRVMIDDDIERLPDNWAVDMVQVMDWHPDCVMLSPQLINPDNTFAFMMGCPTSKASGLSILPQQRLLTAFVMIRDNDLRFDENFVGSGWEDDGYSADLRARYPQGTWMVCHDIRVIHRNEQKNQRANFQKNKEYYESKWGTK